MIAIYCKTAIRQLLRNKLYASITIAGLTLGIACSIIGILYVRDEMSFDRFHANKANLYRIVTSATDGSGKRFLVSKTGQVQGPAFKTAIPGISEYNRIMKIDGLNLIGEQNSFAVDVAYSDANFFSLYSFSLLQGNARSVLQDPYSIVLCESVAKKFFGSADAIGKVLKMEEGRGIEDLKVTGVVKDPPANSSIRFEAVVPFSYLQLMFKDDYWLNQYLTTFILLQPGVSPRTIESAMPAIFAAQAMHQLKNEHKDAAQFNYSLQPITDVHLNSLDGDLPGGSTITYSYILLGVVFFILLIACVNFINLSIAGSIKRSKEIGIRKVAGGSRMQVIIQFLSEAALVCSISFLLALALVWLAMPLFNQLSGKQISFSFLTEADLILYAIGILLLCILAAGLYPAMVLSLFNPVKVLYNRQKLNAGKIYAPALIVLQFTLAIGLIIACIVYQRQMNFIASADPGYNPAHVMSIHLPPQRINAQLVNAFRNELLANPSVKSVATTSEMGGYNYQTLVNEKKMDISKLVIDPDYLPLLEIPLKEGRNFSTGFGTDSAKAVIVNEEFVKQAGWSNPIGQQVIVADEKIPRIVVGVVKDYHFLPLKKKIEPLTMVMGHNEYLLVRIDERQMTSGIVAVERSYKKLIRDHYYQFAFLEDERSVAYDNDKRWLQIIRLSAILAILICCIGLYGLAHFMAQQRTKEIGIRKVLGATVANIIGLLSKRFLLSVSIAIAIASPLAWYFMNEWLANFAYRIQVRWTDFVFAGVMAILIALATVGLRTFNVANANPAKGLRTE